MYDMCIPLRLAMSVHDGQRVLSDDMFTRQVLHLLVQDFEKDWCETLKNPLDAEAIMRLAARVVHVSPRDVDDENTFRVRVISAVFVRAGPLWATFFSEAEPLASLYAAKSVAMCSALSDAEKRRVDDNLQRLSGRPGAARLMASIKQRSMTLLRAVSSGVSGARTLS